MTEKVDVLAGLDAEGLGALVAEIDAQKNAGRTGMEIWGNRILLVFRPDYAVRAWEAEIDVGVNIPVYIHAHETLDGRFEARYREASEIGAELDPVFAGILEGGR